MTDIAKRLRAWAVPVEQGYEVPAAGQAMRDGADEIERLRDALMTIARREAPGSADYDWAEVDYARKVLGWEMGDEVVAVNKSSTGNT